MPKFKYMFKNILQAENKYLLLAECEVRTASYGPSFFLPFMAQTPRSRAMKTRKENAVNNLWK